MKASIQRAFFASFNSSPLATYNFKISRITLNVMKSGIAVNLLQIAFSFHTVRTVREQKPAEFLNSCLILFGVATTVLIGYGHYWIKPRVRQGVIWLILQVGKITSRRGDNKR